MLCEKFAVQELEPLPIIGQEKIEGAQRAQGEQVIAAPTLIKKLPPPLRRIIGDMSDFKRVLVGLAIQSKA